MIFTRRLAGSGLVIALLIATANCASHSSSRPATPSPVSTYVMPDIPDTMNVTPAVREQYVVAWRRLQAGDTRGALSRFTALLKTSPGFYPAEAALGFVQLSSRQYKNANERFATAIAASDRYLPAWLGQVDALLGLGRDVDAIAAMERVLVLDPRLDGIRTRLDLVRFRVTQSLLESGRRARAAGRLDEAEQQLEEALRQSPSSTMILQELTATELSAKRLEEAEAHARQAVELEPREAEWQALLASVFEARGKFREASAAYTRALAIEPTAEWRTRADDMREKAEWAALPPSFAQLSTAASITRAEVAAYIGIRLDALIEAAPRRMADVATDVRTHWASPWILPVTRAGVMTIYPNHTFQPSATMRRGDLAAVVAALVRLPGASRPADLARWQAARPRFPDLPASHVSYAVAALAVSAGAMSADASGRFNSTGLASGADLDSAVRRIGQLATR